MAFFIGVYLVDLLFRLDFGDGLNYFLDWFDEAGIERCDYDVLNDDLFWVLVGCLLEEEAGLGESLCFFYACIFEF